MRLMTLLITIAFVALAPAASPAAAPALQSEYRLSQVEIDQILDEAARKREANEQHAERARPQVHGEVGFAIGTGGYRAAFGTAVVELPDDGFATFSFETSDFGDRANHAFWRER